MSDYSIKINSFEKTGSLLEAMAAVNLPWPDKEEPPFDGEFHTFADPESSSKPLSNKAAWFKGELLPDSGIKVAVFGSFRRPEAGPWHWSSEPLNPATKEELERVKQQAETERRRLQEEAATAALAEWNAATVVKKSEHPYLEKKKVSSYGVLRVKGEILLVPLKDVNGKLHSLTRIWPDGVKRNFPNGDSKGHFCTIGPKPTTEILVATGIATALTCFMARGISTCSVGTDSNLAAVVKALRLKFPTVLLTIAADLGASGQNAAKAALQVAGNPARVVSPVFAQQAAENSDFNDLMIREGLGVVQQQLTAPTASQGQQTADSAWPDPVPLPEELPPVEPFDLALLPTRFQLWVDDISERLQCPPDFPAIGAMIALAAVVGRKLGIRPKRQDDWTVTPNLWGCVIGRPGLLKSPAMHEAIKPIRRLDAAAFDAFKIQENEHDALAEVAEQQKQVNKAKVRELLKQGGADHHEIAQLLIAAEQDGPVRRRYEVNDSTVEKLGEILNENPNGVLIFRDELLGWLATMERTGQEGARQFYLEAWNGNGRFTYDRIGRGTVDIAAACISILGSIQPGPLQDYMATVSDDGLMQRFQLAVWPDACREWRQVDRWPDKEAREAVWAVFQRLDQLTPLAVGATPGDDGSIPYLRFSEKAQEEFDQWRMELERRLRNEELHPALEAYLAKYRSLIPSLALLTHLVDSPEEPQVGVPALLRALAWGDFLESHAGRIYQARMNPSVYAAVHLAQKIKAGKLPARFTLRHIYDHGWSRLNSAELAQQAANVLADHDWLAVEAQPPGPAGGRPRTWYLVNPKISKEG